jgi:small subunit ribosomal protein S15
MISKTKKSKIISKTKLHDKDTGSSDVQVAILTERITQIADHLKVHKKDNSSRRGLLKMVSKRLSHMKYIKKSDSERHAASVKVIKSK